MTIQLRCTVTRNFFLTLFAIVTAGVAWAADEATDDSVVYSRALGKDATDEHIEIDRKIRELLSKDFTYVEVTDDTNYVPARIVSGHNPRTALSASGQQLEGSVWIGYVVTKEGNVKTPHVLKTSDPRLNRTALKAMTGCRFEPPRLNNVVVQSASVTPFSFTIEEAPTEFVTQILEPTGGKIVRPKDWFYSEARRPHSYMWTISREDTAGNKSYRTGVRIQVFMGMQEVIGKSAKQFILDFAKAKKEEATNVCKSCEEEEVGLFKRICLEAEEGHDHILYSMFWDDDTDIAVISIAGTTKELWETYSPTFNKMGEFELIDMKRFEE